MQIATPTTRPQLPAPMLGAQRSGERIGDTLSTTMRTLNDGEPFFKRGHVPTDAQLDAAIATVRSLDGPIADLVASATSVLGASGSHRAFVGGEYGMGRAVASADQQRAQDDAAIRTLARATTTMVRRLEAARDAAAPATAWLNANAGMQDAWAAALTVAHEFEQVHANRFAVTVDGWSRDVLAQFDRDQDGAVDVATEHSSTLTRTGGGTFGVVTDGTALLRAADKDGDGRASRAELVSLGASLDGERDGWISNRDDDAVLAAHPMPETP
jgi:hypothetical protein